MLTADSILPPEFDALKIESSGRLLYARIKDTDVWLDIDLSDCQWLAFNPADNMFLKVIQAWVQFHNS
jgi:hypothetical protein